MLLTLLKVDTASGIAEQLGAASLSPETAKEGSLTGNYETPTGDQQTLRASTTPTNLNETAKPTVVATIINRQKLPAERSLSSNLF